MSRSLCALAVAGWLALGPGLALAQSNQVASGLIVKLKPAADEGKLQTSVQAKARFGRLSRLSQKAGYTSVMPWRHINAQTLVLATPSALTPAVQKALMDKLMATGQVEWVEPNVRQYPAAPTSAAFNPNQRWLQAWGAGNRGVPSIASAWQLIIDRGLASDTANTAIAVLDTGIVTHVNLTSASVLPGFDFVSNPTFSGDRDTDGVGGGWDTNPADPGDTVTPAEASLPAFVAARCGVENENSWHGTNVASIAAATGPGLSGVNPTAKILPVRVAGKCGADLADIVAGMYWAAGLALPQSVLDQEASNARAGGYASSATQVSLNPNPARVLNLSFGGGEACGNTYQEAVNLLRNRLPANKSSLVVASAGNEHAAVSRPANCAGVIAVAALNRGGFKSTYSNFGPQVTVSTLGGDPGSSVEDGYADGGAWGDFLGDESLVFKVPLAGNAGVTNPVSPFVGLGGTSYSAPIVAGVISLMLDVKPDMTASQMEAGLRASARPHVTSSFMGTCSSDNPGRCICTTTTCGAGILDAHEAVRYALALRDQVLYVRGTAPTGQRIDDDSPMGADIQAALRVAPQDRTANAATPTGTGPTTTAGSSGGGGALSPWDLLLLPMLGLWAWLNPRRQ